MWVKIRVQTQSWRYLNILCCFKYNIRNTECDSVSLWLKTVVFDVFSNIIFWQWVLECDFVNKNLGLGGVMERLWYFVLFFTINLWNTESYNVSLWVKTRVQTDSWRDFWFGDGFKQKCMINSVWQREFVSKNWGSDGVMDIFWHFVLFFNHWTTESHSVSCE